MSAGFGDLSAGFADRKKGEKESLDDMLQKGHRTDVPLAFGAPFWPSFGCFLARERKKLWANDMPDDQWTSGGGFKRRRGGGWLCAMNIYRESSVKRLKSVFVTVSVAVSSLVLKLSSRKK